MRTRKIDLDLVPVLLIVAGLELTLNRLAVPVLRPASPAVPGWHHDIDLVGLFSFHLATVLSFSVGLVLAVQILSSKPVPLLARFAVALGVAAFFTLAGASVIFKPPPEMSFHLESAFTVLLMALALALVVHPGDSRVKLGLVLLTIPFVLHYYGTFAVRLILGEGARGSALPDRMRDLGQWSVALCSIAVALCFSPRPLWRAVLKPGPLALAGFVGTLIAVVLVRHQDVGMEIASRGLGIDVGPGAPTTVLIAFILAAAAVTWGLTSTLTSTDPARRQLGMGLGLVCIGGYAFAWPLTLLTVSAGVLAIVQAGLRIPPPVRAPGGPLVEDEAWNSYSQAVADELEARLEHEGDTTLLSGVAAGTPYLVILDRGPEPAIEITFGVVPERAPDLTLQARPDRHLGGRGHPPPPATPAPSARTGDDVFDDRFRLHDRGGLAERVLDEGLRARAAAVIDGWVAAWRGAALRYHVRPGHGAPLDHPVPWRDLAAGRSGDPERLIHVFQLVAELAARARIA